MDPMALYHRSFVDVSDRAWTKHNMWIGEETYERVPMSGSVPAYRLVGKVPRPVDLASKPNQDFKSYATIWEQNNSTLVSDSGWLYPIVDEYETTGGQPVVGHYATVSGSYIVVPREHVSPRGDDMGWLQKLLVKDVPAYVVSRPYPEVGDWRRMRPDDFLSFPVMTDIEGRVLAQLGATKLPDDSIERVDPIMDLIVGEVLVGLGRAAGQKIIRALARRSARKRAAQTAAVIRTLSQEMAQWGVLHTQEASIEGLKVSTLHEIKGTMQRVMGNLIDGGKNTIRAMNIQELDRALQKDGFKLFQAQPFGPPGGYQLFYRNGNVVARVKTMGDAFGKRQGITHASFSLSDGYSLRWENDIAKFTKEGHFAPKNIVSLENWEKNAMGKSQNIGNRNFWYVVKDGHTDAIGDAWANSTHFNAPSAFKLDGVQEIVRRVGVKHN